MNSFTELQTVTDEWRRHNFPTQNNPSTQQMGAVENMLGMIEELGEMAHAFLKQMQGIRTNEDLRAQEEDAVGDLVIYLCGYCSRRNMTLAMCIADAWDEVKDRDWVKYPETGRPPTILADDPQNPHNEVPHFER